MTYTAYKLDATGKASNREELNADELDNFMLMSYGKFATLAVRRSDGRTVIYSDDGQKWVIVKKLENWSAK